MMCAALDDAISGRCQAIVVTLHPDGSVAVLDDGAGWSVEEGPRGVRSPEVILTSLHGGCRAVRENDQVAERFCGLGISIANALAASFRFETKREGFRWTQTFRAGRVVTPLERQDAVRTTGTLLTFLPDPSLFDCTFDAADLSARMAEIARETPCTLTLTDAR